MYPDIELNRKYFSITWYDWGFWYDAVLEPRGEREHIYYNFAVLKVRCYDNKQHFIVEVQVISNEEMTVLLH